MTHWSRVQKRVVKTLGKRNWEESLDNLSLKVENIYVAKNSDAEAHVTKRFPNKSVRHVANAIRPTSVEKFLRYSPHVFNRNKSDGMDAVYHFKFSGAEVRDATIIIRDKTIKIEDWFIGKADLMVEADARTWIGFLRQEKKLVWALLTRKICLKGDPRLLVKFGKCFPN